MVVLRIFSGRIIFAIFLLIILFWSIFMFRKLQDEEDDVIVCDWCRKMGFESVEKYINQEVEVVYKDLETFEMPMYVKQLNMIENGISVLNRDQFVLRGLLDLRSIRKSTNNVFFVESSCVVGSSSQGNIREEFKLDARQACGVESAARANPDRPIYVLHSCPLADDFALRVPEYARAILELHNVYVSVLDQAELSMDWPDPLPLSSTSLGLLALWQFGGTYCDLDTLVLRSLRPLGTNYCGYRDDDLLIGDGVLNFEPLGYGHTVVTQLLSEISSKDVLKEDDPFLTDVVVDQCIQLPEYGDDCDMLTIYDSSVLFTVEFRDVKLLGDILVSEFVDKIKNTSYTINYSRRLYTISKDKEASQVFMSLAKEFCPDVYKRCNHTF